MIQQSVLGARVCIVQLLRVTRLNEWICKHHVHIRSKLEWYLTASSLFFHARRLQEQSWPSAITSKLHVFHQGRTQETIQQFNLRVVGVVPAPRMLDWYQILTKAKIDQVNRWLRCGPGWSKYFTLCGWQELQASMSKSAKAFTRKRISDKAARQSWLIRLESNELWLSRLKTFAGAAGCASVLISFRFIGSAPEVLTTASIIPTNQDGTYRLQLHRSASRQLPGKVKMHTQNKFFVKLTRALNRMKPLWSLHGILVVPCTGKEYIEYSNASCGHWHRQREVIALRQFLNSSNML